MDWNNQQTTIHTGNARRSVSIYRNISRSWFKQSDDHSKNHRSKISNRFNKYLYSVIALLVASPNASFAETIGGVSATASPVANSSGSVTNQAIQVLQGPYITNTYGNGIQCQGPTLNFTPYVTGSASASRPFEPFFDDPVYDVTDLDDDGRIDNPGDILFTKRTRTGQKDNYSLGVGFSATWSRPLDKKLQQQCKEATAANIALMQQTTANKRLDFEIARLKNCGDLMKQGIYFSPKSPYYKVCADVVVTNPGGVIPPHVHEIPKLKTTTSPSVSQTSTLQSLDYDPAALLGAPLQIGLPVVSP